jgi:hypothetical protein
MKNLIKKILREETSGLTDSQIKSGYALMNMITKGYQWYHDTPEKPFEYTEGSIWLINPDTKEWMLELKKSGKSRYYEKTLETFYKYLNMGVSEFESFIKIWVEDVLKRGVITTNGRVVQASIEVKDVLKRGKQLK